MPISVNYPSQRLPLLDFRESGEQRRKEKLAQGQKIADIFATLGEALIKKQKKEKTQKTIEDLKKQGYDFEYEIDPETGKTSIKVKKPKTDYSDILSVIGGLTSPEKVFSTEQLTKATSLNLGQAEGGEVLAPAGATFKEGEIFSPEGEQVGEYLPGYEPKTFAEAIGSLMGKELGITKEEAKRKVFNLPQKKKTSEISFATALSILADPMKSQQIKKFYPELYKKIEAITKGKTEITETVEEENGIMDTNW